ncbi:hypothetical protein ABPG74_001656 [Tetrahymena malaccensis]
MSILNENAVTNYKLTEPTDITYQQQMMLDDNLQISSQFITLLPKYPIQGNKNEGKTYGVIQLEFNKLLQSASNNQMLSEQEDILILNKYCILVDRSQSMMLDNKLKNVKQSLSNLLEKVNPNTEYALISFGSSQNLVFNFTQITQENLDNVKKQINNINATGDTNIVQALEVAHNLIQKDQNQENRVNEKTKQKIVRYSIFLLTDGQDNLQDKAILKIRENFKNKDLNYSINCLGFGIDHDPLLLGAIASYTGGKFYYIKPEETIFPAFEDYVKNQQEVIVENVDIQIVQDTIKTIYDEQKNQYKFLASIWPDENVSDAKQNRIYFKNLRKGDEKNILLSLNYKYKLKKHKNTQSQQDISLSMINDSSRFESNMLDISLSAINKTSLTVQSQKTNDSQKLNQNQQQLQKEQILVKEETIKFGNTDEDSKIDKSNDGSDSSISLSELLSDFSSISLDSSVQEQTNNNNIDKKQYSNQINVEDDKLEQNQIFNDLTLIQTTQDADNKICNQKELNQINKSQEIDKEQKKIEQQNGIDKNVAQDITFIFDKKEQQPDRKQSINFGQINIRFTYLNKNYKFSIPLKIEFTQDLNVKQVENEVCVMQFLRINYLKRIKKSQQLLEKGLTEASLSELKKIEDLLNSKPLIKFPLYSELQKQVKQGMSQLSKFQKSKNQDEKQNNKKDYIISQTVSLTTYQEQSSTKHNN